MPFIGLSLQHSSGDMTLPTASKPFTADDNVQPNSMPRTQGDCRPCPNSRPGQSRVAHRRTNPISFAHDHPPSPSPPDRYTFPAAPYTGQGEQSVFVALGLPPEEETRMNLPAERCQYELGSYDDPWIKANARKSSFYNCGDYDFELQMMIGHSN